MQEGERQFASDKDLANPLLPLHNAPPSIYLMPKRQLMLEHVWQSVPEYECT